ncbi:MAG: hypothetical protein J0L92_10565 [Deltaproteobacteria bacterium]|nr:hypothetical protein [Deltaproteobacteria bacterium]
MSPSNAHRTASFVTFAALVALTGCGAQGSQPTDFAPVLEQAPASPGLVQRVLARGSVDSVPELGSPAQVALGGERASVDASAQLLASSELRGDFGSFAPAPAMAASHSIVIGTDSCQSDDDCVPDGCHATQCVAASEVAPTELACTTNFVYGTTDGGGCLCHVGHCAALVTNPPQGI